MAMRWEAARSALMMAALAAAGCLTSVTPAIAQAQCAEPTGGCAQTLPATCLQTLGAGVTEPATPECEARLEAYRSCLTQAAAACAEAAPSPSGGAELLAPATAGFLSALRTELAKNLDTLRDLRDRMDLTGATAIYEEQWPSVTRRVIDATANPAYFTAPPDWMSRADTLYFEAQKLIDAPSTRFSYRRQATSVLYDRRLIRERLEALIAEGEERLLPEIDGMLGR